MKLLLLAIFLSVSALAITENELSSAVTINEKNTPSSGEEVEASINVDGFSAPGSPSELEINEKQGKILKYPLLDVIATTQWSAIMRELEITMDLGACGEGLKYAIGLDSEMIEFVGYYERVDKPLNFTFAGMSLDGNIVKSNTARESSAADDSPRAQTTNSHFIKLPILGMIFKKKLSFWCLQEGILEMPYISEFEITYKHDFMNYKMIPQMIAMFSPDTLISTVFDCAATISASILNGNAAVSEAAFKDFEQFESTTEKMVSDMDYNGDMDLMDRVKSDTKSILDGVRNTLYYIDGCNGFSPIGGYQSGMDPLTEGHNDFHGIMNILMGASLATNSETFKKQSNFTYLPTSGNKKQPEPVDTMCHPAYFPMPIPSQFVLQEAYPVVGETKEVGQDGITVSTAKNVPGAEGVVFVVWERRDYYAFAYECPGSGKKK